MDEHVEPPKESAFPPAPAWWVRGLVFLGISWIGGLVDLLLSPGGAVQTFSDQVSYIAFLFPIYLPGLAAFAIGGSVHSGVVLFAALAFFYIGSLFLVGVFFGTKKSDTWVLMCVLLAVEVVLALVGSSVFVSNMRNWT